MFVTLFRGLWRRSPLLHVCVCALLLNRQAWSQDTLHILMVTDTADESIGKSCAVDLASMRRFFTDSENIPHNKRTEITFMSGSPPPKSVPRAIPFSGEAVLKHYRTAAAGGDVNPGDTVFFYYSGHGGFDPVKGHFMALDGKLENSLLRSELRAAILKCNARLAVIFTDCCADVVELPPLAQAPAVAKGLASKRTMMMNSLFFLQKGIVDVNASSQGQVAEGKESFGGYFTSVFVEQMKRGVLSTETRLDNKNLPVKKDDKLTWRELFPLLMIQVADKWRKEHPAPDCADNDELPGGKQCTQDPQAYCLPATPSLDPPRLFQHGLTVDAVTKDRKDILIVRSVDKESAAEKGGIRAGDVISAIDAKNISNACEFDCAIGFPPDPNKVTVTIVRDAKSIDGVLRPDRAK